MGDVAMTVPVLRAFSVEYPEVRLTVVSRPFFEPFFQDIPNLDFFGIDLKQRHKGFLGLLRLFRDLRNVHPDAVADLHNVLRSKILRLLFLLTGKKCRATDKGRAEKKALTALQEKQIHPLKTMVARHAETFAKLGFPLDLSEPTFPKKKELTPEILAITGEKKQPWIGIAPFAQYESKVYPLDLMQEVIKTLATENYKILLFGGGAKEIEQLVQLKGNLENVLVVAGKIKLKEELSLISNLDVMLSMDSGNAHIAAMLGIKVISLWGATHPFAGFGPFLQPMDYCLTADRIKFPMLPTSVYGNKQVEGYQDAMRTILPSTVIDKIKKELN